MKLFDISANTRRRPFAKPGLLVAALGLSSLMFLTGCMTAAYVNIPSQTGDFARHNPNTANVREVLVAGLSAAFAERSIRQPISVQLPEGTTNETYQYLMDTFAANYELGPRKRGVGAGDVAVEAIRIRGVKAEVDVIRPGVSNQPQLMTVYLDYDVVAGWHRDRIRVWRGQQGAAVPVMQMPQPEDKTW